MPGRRPGIPDRERVRRTREKRALFEADHVASAFAAIDEAAGAGRPFDVLHDHCGYTTLAMADRRSTPVVHTVHGPFDHDTIPYYARHGAKGRLVCISRSRAGMAPAEADVAAVVSNPVDVDSWPVGYRKQDCVLFMARMVEEKGPHRAIRVAQVASWWEPFGLVMVEALAAGTPVLAFWHARPTVAVPARQPHE